MTGLGYFYLHNSLKGCRRNTSSAAFPALVAASLFFTRPDLMSKPKNVFRIDIEPSDEHPNRHSTHGWQVRVKRHNEQYTKYFSDKKFGGRDEALEKSVEYRDELLEELPEPQDPVRKSALARSKTGVIGLNFCHKDDGSGTLKPYVQISWLKDDGKRRSAAFSVNKWNLRRAVWKACQQLYEAREQQDREVPEPEEMFQTAFPNILEQHRRLKRKADARGNEVDDSSMPDPNEIDAENVAIPE